MKKLISFFILALMGVYLIAQQSMEANVSDTLILNAPEENDGFQWQKSLDGFNWENISSATSSSIQLTVEDIPSYYRAQITSQNCDQPYYTEAIEIIQFSNPEGQLWSDPETWGTAGKPVDGDQVTIPEGKRILLDEDTPLLNGLNIAGSLEFLEQDLNLSSDWIVINGGTLRIGKETRLFKHKATITLTGSDLNQDIICLLYTSDAADE